MFKVLIYYLTYRIALLLLLSLTQMWTFVLIMLKT